ncbi:hypothetical protein Mapa_003840 [Marchantia paleacea]|nr:hypothetical protein Mapa_003840 [Marchantia paleacea]
MSEDVFCSYKAFLEYSITRTICPSMLSNAFDHSRQLGLLLRVYTHFLQLELSNIMLAAAAALGTVFEGRMAKEGANCYAWIVVWMRNLR